MKKVYVLSHGHRCIAHRFGASSFDHKSIVGVFDGEEKVVDYIRENVERRIDILAETRRCDTYPEIEEYREKMPMVYAENSDDMATETQYYFYESYELK